MVQNVVENPMEAKDMKAPAPQRTYGPTAVLKPGILGNFEPKEHPPSGLPGKPCTTCLLDLNVLDNNYDFNCMINNVE